MACSSFSFDRKSSYSSGGMGISKIFVWTKPKNIKGKLCESKLLVFPGSFLSNTRSRDYTFHHTPYQNKTFYFSKRMKDKRFALSDKAKEKKKEMNKKLKIKNMEINLPCVHYETIRGVRVSSRPGTMNHRRVSIKENQINGSQNSTFGLTSKKITLALKSKRISCSANRASIKDDFKLLKTFKITPNTIEQPINSPIIIKRGKTTKGSYIKNFLRKSRISPHRIAVECNIMLSIRRQNTYKKIHN